LRLRAYFSASLAKPVQVNRFRTFAQNRQNGFVALGFCFIKVSWPVRQRPRPTRALAACASIAG
jgi:hypothetical protein